MDGKASERVHAQAHVNAVTPKHACASTGTHICLFGPISIYITITAILLFFFFFLPEMCSCFLEISGKNNHKYILGRLCRLLLHKQVKSVAVWIKHAFQSNVISGFQHLNTINLSHFVYLNLSPQHSQALKEWRWLGTNSPGARFGLVL